MEKNKSNPKRNLLQSPSRLAVVALTLVLAVFCTGPRKVTAASSQAYTQLRLLVEALYEIDSKYVTEKKDKDLMYGAIRGLVASLDPNSSFLSPSEYQNSQNGFRQYDAEAGLDLSVKDNSLIVIAPVEGGPAWKAGIKSDDHILKINNEPTRNLTAMEAARKLQGPLGTKVKLQVVRTGFVKPLDIDLVLEKITVESVSYFPLDDGFYYIRLRNPRDRSVQEFQQILRTIQVTPGRRGIILDLRNTAGGDLEEARKLASTFVGNDVIYSVKGRQSEKKSFNGAKEYQVLKERLPVVILVDQGTAKAAEVIAGALQADYNALLLGYKTFGDCAVTKLFPLKDGSALIVSVGYCYTPRDHLIQGKGLEPDIAGPKKDSEDKPVTESSLKMEKPKKIPDINDVMQDPLVKQALNKLRSWGRNSFTQAPGNRSRKKQASRASGLEGEIS